MSGGYKAKYNLEVTTNTYAVIERWFKNAILHIKSRIRKKNSQLLPTLFWEQRKLGECFSSLQNNTLFRAELSAEAEDIRIEEKK